MAVDDLIMNFTPMLHSGYSFFALIDFPTDHMFVSRQKVEAVDTHMPDYPPNLWRGEISEEAFYDGWLKQPRHTHYSLARRALLSLPRW